MDPRIKQIGPFGDGSVPQKTTVGQTDRIAIDDGAAGFARKYAALQNVLGNTGVEFGFGASVGGGDAGKYIQPHGDANGGKFSTLNSESQLACPVSGTIEALAWISEQSVTNAIWKIWVNGLVASTSTVSGTDGVDTGLAVSISAGDLIAIEFDSKGAGLDPKKTAIELFVRGV